MSLISKWKGPLLPSMREMDIPTTPASRGTKDCLSWIRPREPRKNLLQGIFTYLMMSYNKIEVRRNLLPVGSPSRVQWIMPTVIPQNVKISFHLLPIMNMCSNMCKQICATSYLQVDHVFPAVSSNVHGKVSVFYPVVH